MDSDELDLAPYYDVRRVPPGAIDSAAGNLPTGRQGWPDKRQARRGLVLSGGVG